MGWLEKFFIASAVLGGLLFVVRFILQLVGMGMEGDVNISTGHGDVDHAEPDTSFKLLTIQGLTAFFMLFGLVGIAMTLGSGLPGAAAVAIAFAAGVASMWIIGKLFNYGRKLQSSGTLGAEHMKGGEGSVYLTIPDGGIGKVTVSVNARQREMEAVSADGVKIETGEAVRVVGNNGGRLVVERIKEAQ